MSFVKIPSVLLAFVIFVATIATLISLPKMAFAGELIEKCNRNYSLPLGQGKSDETIARAAHNRLDCYAKEMVLIKQHVKDIKTLNKEVVRSLRKEGLSLSKIAEILNISKSGVHAALKRT